MLFKKNPDQTPSAYRVCLSRKAGKDEGVTFKFYRVNADSKMQPLAQVIPQEVQEKIQLPLTHITSPQQNHYFINGTNDYTCNLLACHVYLFYA